MNFTCIGFGAIFIIAGVLFAFGKLLPKGWKNASEEEKAKVKIKALCINIGLMITLCGVIVLFKGVWAAFGGIAFTITMLVWFAACIVDLIFISKSDRYKNR